MKKPKEELKFYCMMLRLSVEDGRGLTLTQTDCRKMLRAIDHIKEKNQTIQEKLKEVNELVLTTV